MFKAADWYGRALLKEYNVRGKGGHAYEMMKESQFTHHLSHLHLQDSGRH